MRPSLSRTYRIYRIYYTRGKVSKRMGVFRFPSLLFSFLPADLTNPWRGKKAGDRSRRIFRSADGGG